MSIEQAFRRARVSQYGPPRRFRSDREGALSHEAFGVYLEKLGCQRELVTASEQHSMLGPMDRRIQLFREMAPRLSDALAQDGVVIEAADIAAECQLALNTTLIYEGFSPYQCLYGISPNDVVHEELDTISSGLEADLPFYRHQLVRLRAVQVLQESILQARLTRALTSRPRTSDVSSYTIGQQVDVYRRPTRKDLHGWRGPAVLVSLSGEGGAVVRWQGVFLDVPIHNVRPHLPLVAF